MPIRYLLLFVMTGMIVGCGKQGMLPIPPTAPTMVDDGVAYWQAYWQAPAPIVPNGSGCTDLNNEECLKVITKQPPVPEAIRDGTICDHLPDIQKVTCLMNLVAPEKAVVPRCDSVTAEHQYKCLHDAMASPNTTEFPQCACLVDGPTAVPEAKDNYDVPPINEEYGTLGFQWCDMGQCVWEDYDPNSALQKALGNKPHRRMRLTCVDKTRFLITSEDSKVHCIAIREPK